MARIVLSTFGSLGDLLPYLALGRELRRRGHSVAIATFRAYGPRLEEDGLEFRPVRPDIDPSDRRELQRVMDRREGGKRILKDIAFRHLRDSFEDSREAAQGADLVVTHPMAFGMLLVARASGRPWASVALAPLSLLSALDPSVYPALPFGDAFAGLGPGIQRGFQRFLGRATSGWIAPYRQIEAELGLAPGENPILAGQHSPHLVLALFSPLFAPPQPDWPAAARATGFPFDTHDDGLAPELAGFLAEGSAPLVFTLGSAAVGNSGDFYEQSARVAERLGARALLLVGRDPENVPRSLPRGVLCVPYAPHAAVFPLASVIVHQGGIGTTAEAMRAGKPLLVVPFGHDQPDHARRLRRLGIARSIPRERYTAGAAAREISRLLEQPAYASRAAELAIGVRAEDGLRAACDALEGLASRAGSAAVAPHMNRSFGQQGQDLP